MDAFSALSERSRLAAVATAGALIGGSVLFWLSKWDLEELIRWKGPVMYSVKSTRKLERAIPKFPNELKDFGDGEQVVVVMVGLPARGKSYLSNALIRYLNWFGCRAMVFNAGAKRRGKGKTGAAADFFDASNKEAHEQKVTALLWRGTSRDPRLQEAYAMETLDELLDWIDNDDHTAVGIFGDMPRP